MTTRKKITVKYKTQKEFCHCCGQDLEEIETSTNREFDFYLHLIENYAPWSHIDDTEMKEAVEEFVYDTISFYATSHDDRIILFDGEIERVSAYINENLRIVL